MAIAEKRRKNQTMIMMRLRSRALLAAALLASFDLTGCNRSQEAPSAPPPEVAVVTAQLQPALLSAELPGRTSAFRIAEIRPQVNGLIEKRLYTEGTQVEAGQVLYQIDPAPYQAAVDNASASLLVARETAERARAALEASTASLQRHESTLTLARTNLQRYEQLIKTQAASAMQRDQAATDVDVAEAALRSAEAQVTCDRKAIAVAEATITQAEAALETAQINLSYTKITAPISGRIGRSLVTEGAIVTAYQVVPLAAIQQLDPIYVDVPKSTAELHRLKRSLASGAMKDIETDRVKIVLEDDTIYPLEGSLKFHDVTVDPSTGSVILRIVVPNPECVLLPGMFVRAVIEEGIQERAILLPQQAVARNTKGDPIALVVDAEGKVEQRQVTTGRAVGNHWLIASGLAQGDRVIVEGMQKARPGMVVNPIPFESPTAPAETTAYAAQAEQVQAAQKTN